MGGKDCFGGAWRKRSGFNEEKLPGKEEKRGGTGIREIQIVSLVGIAMMAALCDLSSGKIPNALIAAGLGMGLTCQVALRGILGVIFFLGGMLLPALVLGILYYFRMIGAGDIKLLCVLGGFLGPAGAAGCMLRSLFAAGVLSLLIMWRRHILRKRIRYFWEFVVAYQESGRWRSYLEGVEEYAKFCFSVPVLIGILWCLT
ncbi:MAG: A24 family peptidase [Clostridiales bacterium]|nr:A24 family peptidase [Clostridiales bacterium]